MCGMRAQVYAAVLPLREGAADVLADMRGEGEDVITRSGNIAATGAGTSLGHMRCMRPATSLGSTYQGWPVNRALRLGTGRCAERCA